MDINRLQQLAFAEGFVEDFIDDCVDSADPKEAAYMEQLEVFWEILTAGLKDLRQENAGLLDKLEQVKSALS